MSDNIRHIIAKRERNIGQRNKLNRSDLYDMRCKQKKVIRDTAFKSVHRIVDIAKEVRAEDLSRPIKKNAKEKGKRFNRLMSSWTKHSLQEALKSVTKTRGSRLRLVNAAYTSQMDSHTNQLSGRRVGDKFYHVNGDVSHAGTNAAVNIKGRGDDAAITLYMSHQAVKKLLLDRLAAIGGVSKPKTCDRPSRTRVARMKVISTESELPK